MTATLAARVNRRARRQVREAVERPATAAWRRLVRANGVDVTEVAATRSCVVLAPHPDDETIGCGATIARKRAMGTAVRVVVVTDGRHSHRSARLSPRRLAEVRAGEVAEACACLGVEPDELVLLGHEEGTLTADPGRLVDELVEQLVHASPDEVLVTSGRDWHDDHRALCRAARRARDALVPVLPHLRLSEYPVWLWADGPWRDPGRPRGAAGALRPFTQLGSQAVHVVATDGFLPTKRAALACHRSQTSNLTGEPGWAVLDEAFLRRFLGPSEVFLDACPTAPADTGAAGPRPHPTTTLRSRA